MISLAVGNADTQQIFELLRHYLESGALYRLIALVALGGVPVRINDPARVAAMCI